MKKTSFCALFLLLTTFTQAQMGNVQLGQNALANFTGTLNTAIGTEALRFNTSGSYNAALGWRCLYNNTKGVFNIGVGHQALLNNTTGNHNTAVGNLTLFNNTTGSFNIGIGYWTLLSNTTGYDNTAVGKLALSSNTTGYGNVAIGHEALKTNAVGRFNTAIGDWALRFNTTGFKNTAGGNNALQMNTTGFHNTAWGNWALNGNTTGVANSAVGDGTLQLNRNGNYNTAIGATAGLWGSKNYACTYLGADASNTDTTSRSYSTAVGHASRITADYQVRIGSALVQSIGGFVNWSNLSDGRYKKDLREDVKGLDFILQLRPVTYYMDIPKLQNDLQPDRSVLENQKEKDDSNSVKQPEKDVKGQKQATGIRYTGFVAQEVEEAALAAGFDFSGVDKPKNANDLYALRYAEFVVPIVKALQEQQVIIETQNQKIATLEQQVQALMTRLGVADVVPTLRVSPNPAQEVLNIDFQLPETAAVQLKVTDAAGRTVLEKSISSGVSGRNQAQINIRQLPHGTYFLQCHSGGNIQTVKFLVQ
jgi:trimeric autotransporter adhesin